MAPDRYSAHASARMLELDGRRLAPFSRRALAFAIDWVVIAAAVMVGAALAIALGQRFGLLRSDVNVKVHFNFANWYSVLSAVAYFGLLTYLGSGQTVGKRLLRIRVVSLLHPRLSLWHSLERALGYGASALELGFGFLQYFVVENRQTTHDRIAATIVVDERTDRTPRA